MVACVFVGVCFARVCGVIVLVGYFGFAGVLVLGWKLVGICLVSVWFGSLILYWLLCILCGLWFLVRSVCGFVACLFCATCGCVLVWFNSAAFILMLYVFMLASACCGLVGWAVSVKLLVSGGWVGFGTGYVGEVCCVVFADYSGVGLICSLCWFGMIDYWFWFWGCCLLVVLIVLFMNILSGMSFGLF